MTESESSNTYIAGYEHSFFPSRPGLCVLGMLEASQVPWVDVRTCMGSWTPRSLTALTNTDGLVLPSTTGTVSALRKSSISSLISPAHAHRYRRFAHPLAGTDARLAAKVARYTFLSAGLAPAVHARVSLAHPRPIHPKAKPEAQETFRNTFSELAAAAVPEGVDPGKVEIWFQDEARAGQKGMLARLWARRGTRPRVVRDHRYGYCYLFSAACPARGVGAGHVCDRANTEEMNRHLAEIAAKVQPGGHAIVILDGAGWHRSKALEIPPELSLLRLPPYSPELNSMENVFDYLKSNFLANRLFPTVEDARNAVLQAWTYFSEQPALITSIMSRDWAIVRAAAA